MLLNNVSISVIINGRELTEYKSPMNFQHYVEGRDGSEFSIVVKNGNSVDVEAVVSVDGLSVTDGEQAGQNSSGYLIPANGEVVIPGWKLDGKEAAKFKFSGKSGGSYAEQAGHGPANLGVIGLMAFARKPSYSYRSPPLRAFGAPRGGDIRKGMSATRSVSYTSADYTQPWNGPQLGSASLSNSVMGSANATSEVSAMAPDAVAGAELATASVQNLGTEFGDATEFNTESVDFERGDLLAMMELFYDDRQGLKSVGIDVTNRTTRPSAFPADQGGCKPPANWSRG